MRFFEVKEGRYVIVRNDSLPLLARVMVWSLISFSIIWIMLTYPDISLQLKTFLAATASILPIFCIVDTELDIDIEKQTAYLTTRTVLGESNGEFSLSDVRLIKSREVLFGRLLKKKSVHVLRLRYPRKGMDLTLIESTSEIKLEEDTSMLLELLNAGFSEKVLIVNEN